MVSDTITYSKVNIILITERQQSFHFDYRWNIYIIFRVFCFGKYYSIILLYYLIFISFIIQYLFIIIIQYYTIILILFKYINNITQ